MRALEDQLGRLPTSDEFAALIPGPTFDPRLAKLAVSVWHVAYTARPANPGPNDRTYAMSRQVTPEVVVHAVGAIVEHIHRELVHRLRPLAGSNGVTWTVETFITSWNGDTYRVYICPECQATEVAADRGRWPILHACAVEVTYAELDGLDFEGYEVPSHKMGTMIPFRTTVTT